MTTAQLTKTLKVCFETAKSETMKKKFKKRLVNKLNKGLKNDRHT